MNTPRLLAGYLCVGLGFALIVMLGLGVIDPLGTASTGSLAAALLGLLPSVLLAAGVFAIGLWLVKGARKR